jgi:hypothetical protein
LNGPLVESSRTIAPFLRTDGAIVFPLFASGELPEAVLLDGLVAVPHLGLVSERLTVRVNPNDKCAREAIGSLAAK